MAICQKAPFVPLAEPLIASPKPMLSLKNSHASSDFSMLAAKCRRLSALVLRIHVAALFHEQLDDCPESLARCGVERRVTGIIGRVDVGAELERQFDHFQRATLIRV